MKRRLGNIIVAYNEYDKPVFAKDIKADGALLVLLKDAINPNLVQTLNHTPTIIHGGPFANIAHGCNSIRATKLALKLGDYAITEAGFGADLGAEKFLDIKVRKFGVVPKVVVIVATIKALKYHGGATKEEIFNSNKKALENGMENLFAHIKNIREIFGLNVIIALNKFNTDTDEEIEFLQTKLSKKNVPMSIVEGWEKGADGALDIAQKIVDICEKENNFKYAYNDTDRIQTKIEKIVKNIYGAEGVIYEQKALDEIKKIEDLNKANFPICIAKTQFSFSDDSKNLKCVEPFKITIKDIQLKNGAEFIVVMAGKIMTMPGLPKIPAAESIDIDENGEIVGIF
jgi:formate--tetrahydrofolate ligase